MVISSARRGASSFDRVKPSGWSVSLSSFVALLLSGGPLIIYLQSVFLVPVTSELGWTRAEYFTPLFIAGIISALFTPVWGRMADRYGPRKILLPCVVLFGVAYAGLGIVHEVILYSLLLLLALLLQTAHGVVFYAKIILSWPSRRPGLMLGVALAGASAGGMLLPPVANWLIAEIGWRGARLILGLAVICVAYPLVLAFVRSPTQSEKLPVGRTGVRTIPREIYSHRFWLIAANVGLMSLAINGVSANMVPLLTEKGMAVGTATLGISVLAGSSFFARFAAGFALDYSRSALIAVPWVLCGAMGLLLLYFTHSPGIAFLALALLGISFGGEIDFAAFFVRKYFGIDNHGFLYGAAMAVFAVCATTGPLLYGLVYQQGNANGPAILLGFAFLVIASVPLLFLGRYPDEEILRTTEGF